MAVELRANVSAAAAAAAASHPTLTWTRFYTDWSHLPDYSLSYSGKSLSHAYYVADHKDNVILSSVAIRIFRWSPCSWRQSSFEPALPCEQALCLAGIWNQIANETCTLQLVWVTDFHGKVYYLLLPCLEWNAVFLIHHSTLQQRSWRAWQISPFRLPGDFCRHLFFSCQQTKQDHFDDKQEKVVFISKKTFFANFPCRQKISLWKMWFA